MLLPDFLTSSLSIYQNAENEQQLFILLNQNIPNFVSFFILAADDETWSRDHNSFMQLSIEWFTNQFFNEKLPLNYAQDIVNSIQNHYWLKPLINHNITLRVNKKDFPVNSMIIGVTCSYLRDLIRIECFKKKQTYADCQNIPFDMLYFINEFAETGSCSNLWKQDRSIIFKLLEAATETQIHPLSVLCQNTLLRYVDRVNAFEILLQAHQNQWTILKHKCHEILNSNSIGVVFFEPPFYEHRLNKPFGIEFLNFQESTLEIFSKINHLVTDIIFTSNLAEDSEFSKAVQSCPKLVSLNLGHTSSFSNLFIDIPVSLQELDLSTCSWLNNDNLQKMISICPNLIMLSLSACFQIGFQGWGELKKLERLRYLDISRCGFQDDDFALILESIRQVSEFNISDCQKLTDQSFFELARQSPHLAVLNISRNQVSDGGLAEITSRCRHLRKLDLTRCLEITDKGLLKALKFGSSLKEIKLTSCRIQQETIEEIKKQLPFLIIEL
jgi:F-box/leucine-rich repeat protein 2/20